MIGWFRKKPEQRNFTDLVTANLIRGATGTLPTGETIAAVAGCVGIYQKCFEVAELSPDLNIDLGSVVVDLCLRGECLRVIRVQDSGDPRKRIRLLPVASYDISGSATDWIYKVDIPAPSQIETMQVPADGILHFRWQTSGSQPWRGISPLAASRETATLAGCLEQGLANEFRNAPVGSIMPIPVDGGKSKTQALEQAIANLSGQVIVAPTTGTGFGEGSQLRVPKEYEPRRLGANPPDPIRVLRKDVQDSIFAAFGIPQALLGGGADAASMRESFRLFYHASVLPVAAIIRRELNAKLEQEYAFDFRALSASDITGKSRAFAQLVKSELTAEQAASNTGVKL